MDDRRKLTLGMHKQNRKDYADIKDLITTEQGKINAHFAEDLVFQKRTDAALQTLNELLPLVKEKLLPAYEREKQDELAMKWLKERAGSLSFWLKTLTTVGAFVLGVIWLISKLTPKA